MLAQLRFATGRASLGCSRGDNLRQAIDKSCELLLVTLQVADFAPLRSYLCRYLVQCRLALFALGKQFGVLFLALRFGGRQPRRLLLHVGGQGLLAVQARLDFSQERAACPPDRFQVVQIPRQLIGVVTVEEEPERIRIAAQILPIQQFFQLCLLRLQPLLDLARLHLEALARRLQRSDLRRQLV